MCVVRDRDRCCMYGQELRSNGRALSLASVSLLFSTAFDNVNAAANKTSLHFASLGEYVYNSNSLRHSPSNSPPPHLLCLVLGTFVFDFVVALSPLLFATFDGPFACFCFSLSLPFFFSCCLPLFGGFMHKFHFLLYAYCSLLLHIVFCVSYSLRLHLFAYLFTTPCECVCECVCVCLRY